MLEGLLVDLVPYGRAFLENDQRWENSEAGFWGSAGERTHLTKRQLQRHYQERLDAHDQNDASRGVHWGIQTKDGTPIGSIGLGWFMPHHRLAMIGAMIGEPAYWGGGYGTDALLLIVDYAFDWLDLHKVWLGTMSCNARVLRQMEKVGFREEGRHRAMWYADGQWYDDVTFGMLHSEWPGRDAVIARLGLRARKDNP